MQTIRNNIHLQGQAGKFGQKILPPHKTGNRTNPRGAIATQRKQLLEQVKVAASLANDSKLPSLAILLDEIHFALADEHA